MYVDISELLPDVGLSFLRFKHTQKQIDSMLLLWIWIHRQEKTYIKFWAFSHSVRVHVCIKKYGFFSCLVTLFFIIELCFCLPYMYSNMIIFLQCKLFYSYKVGTNQVIIRSCLYFTLIMPLDHFHCKYLQLHVHCTFKYYEILNSIKWRNFRTEKNIKTINDWFALIAQTQCSLCSPHPFLCC